MITYKYNINKSLLTKLPGFLLSNQSDVVPLAPCPLPAPGVRHLRPQAHAGLEDAQLEESAEDVQPGAGHLSGSLW